MKRSSVWPRVESGSWWLIWGASSSWTRPAARSFEAPTADGYPVHLLLLPAGVVLVEGLDLSAAPTGEHLLACLPLNVVGGDGAARAVLLPM